MRSVSIGAIFITCAFLIGCGGKSVVGTWKVEGAIGGVTQSFESDGTFETVIEVPVPDKPRIILRGKYRYADEKITITPRGVEVQGASPLVEASLKAEAKSLEAESSSKVIWKTNNQFVLVDLTPELTFTRS